MLATAPNGAPQEYRAVGYIQFKQEWNDLSKSYVPLTAEQQAKCDELHRLFAEVGAEMALLRSATAATMCVTIRGYAVQAYRQ